MVYIIYCTTDDEWATTKALQQRNNAKGSRRSRRRCIAM